MNKIYGYILVNKDAHIEKTQARATYENTLDAMLLAANNDWTYVPLNLKCLIDELNKAEIYD